MNTDQIQAETKRDQEIQATLARPGAGIPKPMQFVLCWFVRPFVIKRSKWNQNRDAFLRAHAKLESILKKVPLDQVTKRVLVPSQPGLEDSSRYWSVAMTCRHLTIVGSQIEAGMIDVSHGRLPAGKADTAAVKPETEKNESVAIEEYLKFANGFIQRLEGSIGSRDSKTTFEHPWFGPLNVNGWLWLMGRHTNIHRVQIQRIIERL